MLLLVPDSLTFCYLLVYYMFSPPIFPDYTLSLYPMLSFLKAKKIDQLPHPTLTCKIVSVPSILSAITRIEE